MDPLPLNTIIPESDCKPILTLKVIQSYMDPMVTPAVCQTIGRMEGIPSPRGRRDRERKIGHVI